MVSLTLYMVISLSFTILNIQMHANWIYRVYIIDALQADRVIITEMCPC